jgi:hypothetical protein
MTVHIGLLTDSTGSASPALGSITFIIGDMIGYCKDENSQRGW